MYSELETRFADALDKGKLVFTPSESRLIRKDGLELLFTVAPALSKKPEGPYPPSAVEANTKKDEKVSPWLPPDSDLVVEDLENYSVVLNKFALAKYHFLLVTRTFQPQTALLSDDDWETSMNLLKRANAESGKRHIAFFNCGASSGASIAHKHLQFMTLPDRFVPFPDKTPPGQRKQFIKTNVKTDSRVPFAHFILDIESDAETEDLMMKYSELLSHTLTVLGRDHLPISYNLVFTEEWMMITPRRIAKSPSGVAINSLGTVGLMLAKSEEQATVLEEHGFEIVKEVGFPYEPVLDSAPDSSHGFIQY